MQSLTQVISRALAAILAVIALSMSAPVPANAAVSGNPADMPAGTWVSDQAHTSVTARVRHMGVSWYVMRFNTVEARLVYDPAQPEQARLTATVQAASLDVGADYSRRFAEQFLDSAHNPTVTFVSTGLHRTGPNTGTVTGDLTLRGVTRPVTFDVTFNGVGPGLIPLTTRAGFTAVGTIRRSEFGSGFLQNIVGDDVTITIEVEFAKQ